jgi:Holliday junction resolvase-like predicted endonuclease
MRPWTEIACALALTLVVGLSLGAWLMRRWRVARDSRLARERNERGKLGEDRAETLLLAAGYEIVARQQRTSYRVLAAERSLQVGLILDFVVAREGRQLVAEVKTGAVATQLKHADTRRQLLEYQLASGASSVLLVDPERECITEVAFPLAAATPALVEPPPLPAASATEPLPVTATHSNTGAWLLALLAVCALSALLWFALQHNS